MSDTHWTPAELDRFLRLGIEPDHAVRHREAVTAKAHKETSEAVFQARVLKLAENASWLCYHTQDSRRSRPGFPDVVLVRDGRVIFAELKREGGKLRPEQAVWVDALSQCEGVSVYVWMPSDISDIERILR